MADIPVFGADQIDQNPTVSLPTRQGSTNGYWYDYFRGQYDRPYQQTPYGTHNQDQARLEQQRVIQDLQRQAAGDMNSQAQGQLRQGYQQAQGQQASLGSTMRGQSAGAAMRGIQQGQQGIQRGFAGDQQMLKLQEQQAAQAMLAQMLEQQRNQDFALSQNITQNTLGQQGLYDQGRDFYLNGMLGTDLAATENQNAIARAQLGFEDKMRDLNERLIQGGMNAGATAAGTYFGMGKGGSNG